jgi:Predicted esterase of the alpha-beta hydrolase superfamily
MDVTLSAKAKQSRLEPSQFEQTVLLLQGGGALGSYQAGVYQALAEADLDPDWVAGISIGAINAALIAGNPRESRVEKLREFWEAVSTPPSVSRISLQSTSTTMSPSFHQSDARVRHHVIRRAAFLHAPSAFPDVLAVTKGRPAQLL